MGFIGNSVTTEASYLGGLGSDGQATVGNLLHEVASKCNPSVDQLSAELLAGLNTERQIPYIPSSMLCWPRHQLQPCVVVCRDSHKRRALFTLCYLDVSLSISSYFAWASGVLKSILGASCGHSSSDHGAASGQMNWGPNGGGCHPADKACFDLCRAGCSVREIASISRQRPWALWSLHFTLWRSSQSLVMLLASTHASSGTYMPLSCFTNLILHLPRQLGAIGSTGCF